MLRVGWWGSKSVLAQEPMLSMRREGCRMGGVKGACGLSYHPLPPAVFKTVSAEVRIKVEVPRSSLFEVVNAANSRPI